MKAFFPSYKSFYWHILHICHTEINRIDNFLIPQKRSKGELFTRYVKDCFETVFLTFPEKKVQGQ